MRNAMMTEWFLGQLIRNQRIDPLAVKANVVLAGQYADTLEQEYKKECERREQERKREQEQRDKEYKEKRRVEEERCKQERLQLLKKEIKNYEDSVVQEVARVEVMQELVEAYRKKHLSTAEAKAEIRRHDLERGRLANSLAGLRKELEQYEPTNTGPISPSNVPVIAGYLVPEAQAQVASKYSEPYR